jgi:hypothetical protein
MYFENKETYWASYDSQGSNEWLKMRIGRMTMSQISACTGRSTFKVNLEDEAKKICGLIKLESNPFMIHGKLTEPVIRDWYSQSIEKPIREVGLAIWKKDPRFGGSLDGEIDENEGIEIKAPHKMYRKLINYIEFKKKGYNNQPPGYHEHIYNNHYDQMTGYGVITNKKYMHYVVVCSETQEAFVQRFPVDYDLWENELYPKACQFYEEYVVPMMKENNIQRIDP